MTPPPVLSAKGGLIPSESQKTGGGVNRIADKFSELKRQNKKALILFITAGDPTFAKDEELIYSFEKEGVDFVELGVPFSDPLADGPVIQASSLRALRRHATLKKILTLVRRVRKKSQIPILLMSYLNPILSYGVRRFAGDARRAGVDGLIVPDLPPEEGTAIAAALRRDDIDLVYFLAPTSTPKRRKLVAEASSGFIYYVSLTGVTGIRKSISKAIGSGVRAAKKETSLPICVGFGISTPSQARTLSKAADGVILGSVIVRALADHPHLRADQFAKKFVRPFANALGKKREDSWLRQ